MQDTVSLYGYKVSKSLLLIIVMSIITLGIIGICVFFSIKKEPTDLFDEKKIYLVYTNKSLKQNELKSEQDLIKKLGGSGEIFFYKDYYYLISSVYSSEDDAKSVVSKIKQNFTESGSISLKIKKISQKTKTMIYENPSIYKLFMFQNDLLSKILSYEIDYLAGNLPSRDFSSYILEQKLELERINDLLANEFVKLSNTNGNEDVISLYEESSLASNLYLLYFNNFLNKFFESSKKDSLVCEIASNIALCYYDFCNNL